MRFPPNMPVRYEGKKVGTTLSNNDIVIEDDDVYKMLNDGRGIISLEVVRNDD